MVTKSKNDIPRKLPDFIVIGAMKAGTTSLYNYLNAHPGIFLPTQKELDFFNADHNWNKGIEWYESKFVASELKKGEVSPNYAMYPLTLHTPERMYSVVPDAKLLYILRDPIERMLSQINYLWIVGLDNRTLEEILADEADTWCYINGSRYFTQLERFLRFYSRNNICLLTTEELSSNPLMTMESIFSFIEVDNTPYEGNFTERQNVTAEMRKHGKLLRMLDNNRLLHTIKYRIGRSLPEPMLVSIKRLMTGTQIPKPTLTEKQVNMLQGFFSEDVSRLREFARRDFAEWSHKY